MRAIKSLADVQIVLNQLLNWQTNKDSKDWDFHGLRIKNASASVDANDYVIRSELHPNALAAPPQNSAPKTVAQVNNPPIPAPTSPAEQDYTVVICVDGPSNGYESAPFIGGRKRDGVFIDAWAACTGAPVLQSAFINWNINGTPLLSKDIEIPAGSLGPIHSSFFVSPLPVMGFDTRVTLKITTASGMTFFSGGLVVRRNPN
jgi:hypothetical protein